MFGTFEDFISGKYEPHGYCLLWQPGLIWTHVISDALIAAAYFSIPLALVKFVRKRNDVAFGWMIWLFAAFILACGTTHIMGIWNLWHGDYGAEAIVKAITAGASVPTAILLWRLIPRALAIPSPSQLQLANEQLLASVEARDEALRRVQAEIAHRERAEAALLQAQKMDAIGQLTGGIAHDFNNLLQAVSGNLDLIRAQPGNAEKVTRWASNARNGLERGTRLTGQLLAFSRTQRLELHPIDANALIEGMQDLLQSSVGSLVCRDIRLEPGISYVEADSTQLELAILNLAINARDARPDGGSLTLSTREVVIGSEDVDPAPGCYVEITVADTGTGMPPEVLDRALEPFFTTKELGSGTGLGLSMAFGVARQSGGALRLRSSVGVGTTVSFLLPCTQARPREQAPVAPTDALVSNAALADLRVAVIDDDLGVRQFVVDCLENHGIECHSFDGGESFLASFATLLPDMVFLDFAMPGLSGAEVARRLRTIDARVPVVIMTGYADSKALDEILDGVRVIRKPFAADTILDIARTVYIQSHGEREAI